MDMTGEYRIPAPRERVWAALNDPEILKQAIPGCEELKRVSENELEATVRSKIGPVSARFSGKVTLSDLNPPESYRISGEGKGGAAGFAKGGANVNLSEEGSETLLRYTAQAEVGGKLAQIGSRLVQGSAKKMADDFFGRFAQLVAGQGAAGETATSGSPATAAPAIAAGAPAAPTAAIEAAPRAPSPVPPSTPAATGEAATMQTGGAERARPISEGEGTASSQIARDPIGAEFPGTVGLDRPAADPDTGRTTHANASIDAGDAATPARDLRGGPTPGVAPKAGAAPAGPAAPPTGASPMPSVQGSPWYANPVVWVVLVVIILIIIYALS